MVEHLFLRFFVIIFYRWGVEFFICKLFWSMQLKERHDTWRDFPRHGLLLSSECYFFRNPVDFHVSFFSLVTTGAVPNAEETRSKVQDCPKFSGSAMCDFHSCIGFHFFGNFNKLLVENAGTNRWCFRICSPSGAISGMAMSCHYCEAIPSSSANSKVFPSLVGDNIFIRNICCHFSYTRGLPHPENIHKSSPCVGVLAGMLFAVV